MSDRPTIPTTLYHGTACYELESFLSKGVEVQPRRIGKPAFCATTKFQEAAFFALRKTPAIDLSKTGIVLEFDAGRLRPGEYCEFDDHALRHEYEIRVFDGAGLYLIAYHEYDDGTWRRVDLTQTGGDE